MDGQLLIEQDETKVEAINYFKLYLNGDHESQGEELLQHIPRFLSREDRDLLDQFPTIEEIKGDVEEIDGNSSAGPDRFNEFFYKTCWDILKHDFYDATSELFACFNLLRAWTSTLIVPMPKVENPTELKHLRPISLRKFSSKVICNVLSNRLTLILQKIISPEQSGFVKGKLIQDNIL